MLAADVVTRNFERLHRYHSPEADAARYTADDGEISEGNMQLSNVVLLQSDPVLARSLIASLCNSFRSVHMASSLDELRSSVAKHRSDVAIIDMESASIPDVHSLSSEFPGVSIVCTHRLADEEMWTEALNAGAADICPSNDTRGILTAAVRSAGMMHSAAA